jgi:hypothetical protein
MSDDLLLEQTRQIAFLVPNRCFVSLFLSPTREGVLPRQEPFPHLGAYVSGPICRLHFICSALAVVSLVDLLLLPQGPVCVLAHSSNSRCRKRAHLKCSCSAESWLLAILRSSLLALRLSHVGRRRNAKDQDLATSVAFFSRWYFARRDMKLNLSSLTSRAGSREHIRLKGEVAKAECECCSLPSEQFPQYSARNGTAIRAGDRRQEAKKRFVDLCAGRFFGHDNISDKLSQRNEGGHGQRPSPRPLGRKDSEHHGCRKQEERSKQQVGKFQIEKSGAQSQYDAKNMTKISFLFTVRVAPP